VAVDGEDDGAGANSPPARALVAAVALGAAVEAGAREVSPAVVAPRCSSPNSRLARLEAFGAPAVALAGAVAAAFDAGLATRPVSSGGTGAEGAPREDRSARARA